MKYLRFKVGDIIYHPKPLDICQILKVETNEYTIMDLDTGFTTDYLKTSLHGYRLLTPEEKAKFL